jgi:outer membrane protein assembly factor BamE (lipoprotein component of BamABCDE complex)
MKIVILRKKMIIVSSILLLPLFCLCCAFPVIPTTVSHRGPVDDESLSFLQVGKTTKEDVLLKLGNPTYCFEDEESFDYCWEILRGGWFIGGGYTGEFGSIGEKRCLSLEFDKQGILTKYSVEKRVIVKGDKVEGGTYLYEMKPNCR